MLIKSFAFIIPHKGREQFLLQTIRSVAAQDYDLSKIEVIVVTQNERLSDELHSLQDQVALSAAFREAIGNAAQHGNRDNPEKLIKTVVRRMLPKNRIGRDMLRHLKVYPGAEHPHQAQNPTPLSM